MADRGRNKKREPRRQHQRSKATISEAPLRVALATSPQSDYKGALEHDLELAKAALLYADEVEMVGLGVSLLDRLWRETYGPGGMFGLLRSLDDSALAYVSGAAAAKYPEGWRENFDRFIVTDLERLRMTQPGAAEQLRRVKAQMDELSAGLRPLVDEILEVSGSAELRRAVEAKVIRIADLDTELSSLFRGSQARGEETVPQIQSWIDALMARMRDRTVHLLFDRSSGELIQEMFDNGSLPRDAKGVRLATQAALGAGLVARLPAFPRAPMDELLDLRHELRLPLQLYRAAVVRYARALPLTLNNDLDFEIQQIWDGDVRPAIQILKDELADHSLVKEMARSVSARDLRTFGWTAATSVGVSAVTDIGALTAGAIAVAGHGVPLVAEKALDAIRKKHDVNAHASRRDFYYLYEAERRLQ